MTAERIFRKHGIKRERFTVKLRLRLETTTYVQSCLIIEVSRRHIVPYHCNTSRNEQNKYNMNTFVGNVYCMYDSKLSAAVTIPHTEHYTKII